MIIKEFFCTSNLSPPKQPLKLYQDFWRTLYYTLTKFIIYTIQMVLCNVYFQMCLLWKTIKNTSTFKHAYWNEPLKWLTSWTLSMYNVWNVSICILKWLLIINSLKKLNVHIVKKHSQLLSSWTLTISGFKMLLHIMHY